MASFALRLCFVLAALLMASFVCGTPFFEEKPGLCPRLNAPQIPGHDNPCSSDYDCPRVQKCCLVGSPSANAKICAEPYIAH